MGKYGIRSKQHKVETVQGKIDQSVLWPEVRAICEMWSVTCDVWRVTCNTILTPHFSENYVCETAFDRKYRLGGETLLHEGKRAMNFLWRTCRPICQYFCGRCACNRFNGTAWSHREKTYNVTQDHDKIATRQLMIMLNLMVDINKCIQHSRERRASEQRMYSPQQTK